MTWTQEQIDAMEEENDTLAALQEEEEMRNRKPFVPPMPVDGEETDEREE